MDRAAWWATVHEVLMSIGLEARLLTLKSYPDINCITWTSNFVVAVQSLSHVHFFVTPLTTAYQASLSFTISWNLHKFMSVFFFLLEDTSNLEHDCVSASSLLLAAQFASW